MDEDHHEQPPSWASALLERIANMEQRLQPSPIFNTDPNVIVRTPGADFTPSDAMLAEFPFITEDFFKRPLAESDRRRFLFDCPKNSLRNYDPPKLNKVQLNHPYKQFDAHLSTLQYRLSGITRPVDWFAYQLLQENWDVATIRQQARDFTHAIHELLSDLASHITTLRTENMFRGLPSNLEPPAPTTDTFLIDTQETLDHIKLQRSVHNATQQQRKRNNGPRPKHLRNNNNANESNSPIKNAKEFDTNPPQRGFRYSNNQPKKA
jgi:hypothetical protein